MPNNVIRLLRIEEFRGTLKVLESGLRIGGSKDSVGIGETDNPIIRHPITNLPYIPGSSLKGKLRSLLELVDCPTTQATGKPCDCGRPDCLVCVLFGPHNSRNITSPTRLLFRDSQATEATRETWTNSGADSEIKTEVLIDRKKGLSSGNIGPRTTERIASGGEFNLFFSVRIFDGDAPAAFYDYLAKGFELLGKDYLGGHGSRGYGHVAMAAEDGKSMHEHLREIARGIAG